MPSIGNYAPDRRAFTCHYCGALFMDPDPKDLGIAFPICPDCYDRSLFSDFYKDKEGFRPRWELEHWTIWQMRDWLEDRFAK